MAVAIKYRLHIDETKNPIVYGGTIKTNFVL